MKNEIYIKKYNKYKNKLKLKNNFKFLKKFNKLKEIKNKLKENKKLKNLIKESKKLFYIKDLKELAKEDILKYKSLLKINKKKIKNLTKKSNKKKHIFLEIKMGIGGIESSNFIENLSKMYIKFFEKNKINFEIINIKKKNSITKDVLILIKKNIFKKLKNESGIHRVQRLPITENYGRIHTSTCRVLVYKKKNLKKKFNINEFKIETFKSSGSGGQHVNTTNSAIRVKHISSGLTVEYQNERSQHMNKKKALEIIKNKIWFNLKKEKKNEISIKKKFLIGNCNRSEKIRTYNYQKNLLVDHRINLKLYKLDKIMNGELNELLKILIKKL